MGSGSPVVIETFTSDDDGNLLTRTDTATSVVTSYTWDDFNRLTAVSATDASKNQTHTFGVNGFRRKKKDKNDVETTEYAAGLETAVAKNSTETITYLTGGGGIMGFERTSDGAMFYFITDALSTVRDVVDSSGTVVAGYEFSEYGQKISPANTNGVESQKTFVGGLSVQDEVADTGLMLMGHRFYDPGLLGRFLNRDPIGYAGGLNLFEYSANRPVMITDHSGLKPGDFSDAIGNYSYLYREADLAIDRGDYLEATFLRATTVFYNQSGAVIAHQAGEGWGSGQATAWDSAYYSFMLLASATSVNSSLRAAKPVNEVVLDTNALIACTKGLSPAVRILNGRAPVIGPQVLKEFLVKGSKFQAWLLRFLFRGRQSSLESTELAESFRYAAAAATGKTSWITNSNMLGDAKVAANAIEEGLDLLTQDKKLLEAMENIGFGANGF